MREKNYIKKRENIFARVGFRPTTHSQKVQHWFMKIEYLWQLGKLINALCVSTLRHNCKKVCPWKEWKMNLNTFSSPAYQIKMEDHLFWHMWFSLAAV